MASTTRSILIVAGALLLAAPALADGDDPGGTGNDLASLMSWDISSIPADAVVEGCVRKVGHRLRITVQLVDAAPSEVSMELLNRYLDLMLVGKSDEQRPEVALVLDYAHFIAPQGDPLYLSDLSQTLIQLLQWGSDPAMSETEALSYLVLGRPLPQDDSEDREQVNSASAALALGVAAGYLALSGGTPPAAGAAFVEGFLAGSGSVLVHDADLLAVAVVDEDPEAVGAAGVLALLLAAPWLVAARHHFTGIAGDFWGKTFLTAQQVEDLVAYLVTLK